MWPAMAVVEMGMLMVHNLSLGYQSRLGWLTGAILPWCVYAVTLRGIGRHGRGPPAYRALPRLLVVGFAAAVLNSLLLTALDLNDDGSLAAGLPQTLVSFALGAFGGTVLMVPILLALAHPVGPERRPGPLLLPYAAGTDSPTVVRGVLLH